MKSQKNLQEYCKARIQKLRMQMQAAGIACCLIENPLDLFYFTGLQISSGRLLIGAAIFSLFVDGRYIEAAQNALGEVAFLEEPQTLFTHLKQHGISAVHFDAAHTVYQRYLKLKETCPLDWIPAAPFFRGVRLIKDEWEREKMKKSAELAWKGYEWIQSALKTGVTEKKIAKGFEIFCLEQGADRLSFEPIIAFGKNGAMPHYRSGDAPLKDGDAVLIDIGVVLDHYHSDMTRVVFHGKADPLIAQLYDLAKQAQRKALDICRPGIPCGKLDQVVREFFAQENVEHLFVHSLGHGIGLETHEAPLIRDRGEERALVLEAHMAITIEPGLYISGKGGVRYEDTILITENGFFNLYN